MSISSLLVISSGAKPEFPVTLPPGRARLAIKPAPMGSVEVVITMGMVLVAPFAANGVGPPEVTIRSTFRRTSSAASSGSRSRFCSANRYSMVIFFPQSTQACAALAETPPRGPRYRKQCYYPGNLCGRFSLSAAPRADEQSAKSIALSARPINCFRHEVSPRCLSCSLPFAPCSLLFDQPTSPGPPHPCGDSYADLLGGS